MPADIECPIASCKQICCNEVMQYLLLLILRAIECPVTPTAAARYKQNTRKVTVSSVCRSMFVSEVALQAQYLHTASPVMILSLFHAVTWIQAISVFFF